MYVAQETLSSVQPQIKVVRALTSSRWKVGHGFVAGVVLCALTVTAPCVSIVVAPNF
ncbi:hypothetical protein [Photorhabdus sp. RM71S]|uniref:hypothetical protein n=1 Tax=Photorhabdus sp. RM71S TaxID=3342824 RepID=UPI0036DD7F47